MTKAYDAVSLETFPVGLAGAFISFEPVQNAVKGVGWIGLVAGGGLMLNKGFLGALWRLTVLAGLVFLMGGANEVAAQATAQDCIDAYNTALTCYQGETGISASNSLCNDGPGSVTVTYIVDNTLKFSAHAFSKRVDAFGPACAGFMTSSGCGNGQIIRLDRTDGMKPKEYGKWKKYLKAECQAANVQE